MLKLFFLYVGVIEIYLSPYFRIAPNTLHICRSSDCNTLERTVEILRYDARRVLTAACLFIPVCAHIYLVSHTVTNKK